MKRRAFIAALTAFCAAPLASLGKLHFPQKKATLTKPVPTPNSVSRYEMVNLEVDGQFNDNYTYTVRDKGKIVQRNALPGLQRYYAGMEQLPAAWGIGYYTPNGSFLLVWAFETWIQYEDRVGHLAGN